jgi:hypothetical protein
MYKTLGQLQKVLFPLYEVPTNNFDNIDGILFVDGVPMDDLNRSDKSIGIRRIKSGRKDFGKLRNPKFTIGDVIKSKKKHFISSDGKLFTYEKTAFQKIKYMPILRYELRNTFTFVFVEGITIPFEVPRPPTDKDSVPWVRILYYRGFPWMVYDFALQRGKDSIIKV